MASELAQWQVGDILTFKSKGGLAFMAGAGVGYAGINVTKLAQGTWETYYHRCLLILFLAPNLSIKK